MFNVLKVDIYINLPISVPEQPVVVSLHNAAVEIVTDIVEYVTFCLFCQSLADLDETYGEATRRTILDNCPYQAILGANDAETQQYFSSRVGVVKLPKRGVNLNYKMDGAEAGFSASMNEAIEPTIFPHEFGAMDNIVLLHPEGFSRVDKFLPEETTTKD